MGMDKNEFVQMLRSLLAHVEEDDDGNESPPEQQAIYALTGFMEQMGTPVDYEVGDIVMLKPNMMGYRFPTRKYPGVVMEINDWETTLKADGSSIDKRENVIVACAIQTGKTAFGIAMYALDQRFLMRHDEACQIKDAQFAELQEMLGEFGREGHRD